MNNIPKILHLYWGKNKPLSYLRYLTAYSFSKYNPDWKIKIYYPKHPGENPTWKNTSENKAKLDTECTFDILKYISNVEMIEIDFDNNINDIFRADTIRLEKLSTVGGVWSDFDILYLKPITDANLPDSNTYMSFNTDSNFKEQWYHSIGWLGACENNKVFKLLKDNVSNYYNPDDYQSIGSHMYNDIITENQYYNIPFNMVYPVRWFDINRYFKTKLNFYQQTIGVHWFGGADISTKIEHMIIKDKLDLYTFRNSMLLNNIQEILS